MTNEKPKEGSYEEFQQALEDAANKEKEKKKETK